jgi:AcrR family transcriptional regulator
LATKSDKPKPARQRARRGTGEQRIVEEAKIFFADHGFRGSTRELARQLGVTQALIYKYFPSKQALIDAVFQSVFIDTWDPAVSERLTAKTPPLDQRLTEFYQAFAQRGSPVSARLFMRANLDDQKLADRYTFALNERILSPVVVALRREARLPTVAKKPMMRAERELAMSLHSAIVLLGIRKYIYNSPLPDNLDDHVALYVENFLAGAPSTMTRIHREPQSRYLGARLGGRANRPKE